MVKDKECTKQSREHTARTGSTQQKHTAREISLSVLLGVSQAFYASGGSLATAPLVEDETSDLESSPIIMLRNK